MSPDQIQWLALGLLLLFAICVAGIVAYCGDRYESWRAMRIANRAERLPPPQPDPRDWQGQFQRAMKNAKTEVV